MNIYVYAVNSSINEFLVVADTTTEYSEEFINVVLGGKKEGMFFRGVV